MENEIVGRGWGFPPKIGPHGRLQLTSESCELEQAINIILSTAPGERVMRPDFGCRIHELIFAPNNSQTAARVRRYVQEDLGMWEPRIRTTHVDVYADPGDHSKLLIEIEFELKTTHDRRSLVYPFYLEVGAGGSTTQITP